jgi:hypothetical protein
MSNGYFRAALLTNVLLALFYLTMKFGLGFGFDGNVAGVLAAAATWSLPVLLGTQTTYPIGLPYRHGLLGGSSFALVMMIFSIALLIVGAKSHVWVPIVVVVLMLPAIAINVLLERIFLTAEERLEINKTLQSRYIEPGHAAGADPVTGEDIR